MSISHSESRPAASLIFVRPWAFSPSLSGCATLPLLSSLPVPTPPPAEVLSSGSAWLPITTSCNLACCKRSSAILRSRLFASARATRLFNCGSRNVDHHCHRSGLAPPDPGSLGAGGTVKLAGRTASGVRYSGPTAQPRKERAIASELRRIQSFTPQILVLRERSITTTIGPKAQRYSGDFAMVFGPTRSWLPLNSV